MTCLLARTEAWLGSIKAGLTSLQRRHPIPEFDDKVEFFEEEHYYVVRGLRYRGSGTGVVHSMFPHFDEPAVIERMIRKPEWDRDPSYRYYQKSAAAIAAEWKALRDDASRRGTILHAYIEAYYNGLEPFSDPASPLAGLTPADLGPEYVQFHCFDAEHVRPLGLEPFRTELIVADESCEFAGMVDLLFRPTDVDDPYVLDMYDHKRSKGLRRFTRDSGYGPCAHMPDVKEAHYFLQLNLYKAVIERETPYRIRKMALSVFHPLQETYQVVPVPPMPEVAATVLAFRRRNLIRADVRWLAQHWDEDDPERQKRREHYARLCTFVRSFREWTGAHESHPRADKFGVQD